MPENSDYRVGYKKPPTATRFKKGRSGNPSGRPKNLTQLGSTLEKILSCKIRITENGKRRTVTGLEALLAVLRTKALSGNIAAAKLLLDHIHLLEEIKKHATQEFVFNLHPHDMKL